MDDTPSPVPAVDWAWLLAWAMGALVPRLMRDYRLDRGEAEDVAMEALARAWSARAGLTEARPANWVEKVARRVAIDRWRRAGRRPPPRRLGLVPVDDDGDSDGAAWLPVTAGAAAGADEEAERHDLRRRVLATLRRLPAEQGYLLWLHYAEGYTQTALQDLTGLPLGTVKTRLSRGRARFLALWRAAGPAA